MEVIYFFLILAAATFVWIILSSVKKTSPVMRKSEKFGEGYVMPFDFWLDSAASHMSETYKWNYETAKMGILSYLELCDISYPDPEYEWSERSAIEFAEEYIKELYA